MLTPKQKELLLFIHERVSETGVAPSFDEMKNALDLRSKSGIHRLITALEERGFLRRLPHRARALEILKLPETQPAQVTPPRSKGFSPSVIEGSLGKTNQEASQLATNSQTTGTVCVPLMGEIAAGSPISAIENKSNEIEVPSELLSSGTHYALTIVGRSMIDVGILDGDTVIIKKCETADNGDIVVALVEDQEATLKRLRKKGQSIALEAANPEFETQIYRPDQVRIQGRLVGLLRQY